MSRKEDRIISIEVIPSDNLRTRDAIIVVTWSDYTKSLWFARKAPKYVKELVKYCNWKGEFTARETLSLIKKLEKNY